MYEANIQQIQAALERADRNPSYRRWILLRISKKRKMVQL
jgi:hypothetical protein